MGWVYVRMDEHKRTGHFAMEDTKMNGVDRVLDLVKERTGYPVAVTPSKGMSAHATMQTATPEMPVHAIQLNMKYGKTSNYVVALQAAMILVKWEGRGVCDCMIEQDVLKEAGECVSRENPLDKLDRRRAAEYAAIFVSGLVRQVVSLPVQILAADWCYRNCPELHDEQRIHVRQETRENTGCLAPEVRDRTPTSIFDKNASMNAAYATWWGLLAEETQAVLPYELLGFRSKGRVLHNKVFEPVTGTEKRYCVVVDRWADELGLRNWYTWQER